VRVAGCHCAKTKPHSQDFHSTAPGKFHFGRWATKT
jgi:hypothetical protein